MSMQETHSTTKDNLFAASQIAYVVNDKITVAEGQTLKRGSLLTSAGALVTTAADVYAVLSADIDTTEGAKEAPVYLTGEFSEQALIVGDAITAADCKEAARKIGIFIKKNIEA